MEQTLGKRISQNRKRLGLTQDQLAEQLGVTAQAVSKWENDLSCPDITMLPKLASIFGITTDALLGSAPQTPVHTAEVVKDHEEERDGLHVCGGNFEFNWNGGRRNALSLALLVLAVGVQLLLSRILCRDMSFWNILWPTTLIVYGSVALTKRFSFLPLGCSLFGLYYLLIYWKLVPFFEDVKLLFPVALVIFGVSLFAGALRKPKKPQFRFSHDGSKRKSACSTDNGYLDFSASFGDNDQYISMTQLNGGQISTSFGDYAIDLSGVQALREGCTLDVNCSFGELLLLVPRRFAVKHSSATSFGEFEICGHPEEAPQGTLYLKTSVSFGEITVRYV